VKKSLRRVWTVPAAFTLTMLALSLQVVFSADSGKTYLTLLSLVASLLVGAAAFVHREVFKPRLGSASSYALMSVVVFVLVFLLALLSPKCPTGSESTRCSLSESAAAGFSMMLLPLVVAVASSLVVLTRLSLYALRKVFGVVNGRSRTAQKSSDKKSTRSKKAATRPQSRKNSKQAND